MENTVNGGREFEGSADRVNEQNKKYMKERAKKKPSSLKNAYIYGYTYLEMAIGFQNKMHVLEHN
jgi:hypothetical protein